MTITLENNEVITNRYIKSTFSGSYLNFSSGTFIKYQRNTVIDLVNTVSHARYRQKNIRKVKHIHDLYIYI